MSGSRSWRGYFRNLHIPEWSAQQQWDSLSDDQKWRYLANAVARGCAWDDLTVYKAALHGHMALLQWVHANGNEWDGGACEGAASGGHLAVLQWLHANGYDWEEDVCAAAAER